MFFCSQYIRTYYLKARPTHILYHLSLWLRSVTPSACVCLWLVCVLLKIKWYQTIKFLAYFVHGLHSLCYVRTSISSTAVCLLPLALSVGRSGDSLTYIAFIAGWLVSWSNGWVSEWVSESVFRSWSTSSLDDIISITGWSRLARRRRYVLLWWCSLWSIDWALEVPAAAANRCRVFWASTLSVLNFAICFIWEQSFDCTEQNRRFSSQTLRRQVGKNQCNTLIVSHELEYRFRIRTLQ